MLVVFMNLKEKCSIINLKDIMRLLKLMLPRGMAVNRFRTKRRLAERKPSKNIIHHIPKSLHLSFQITKMLTFIAS